MRSSLSVISIGARHEGGTPESWSQGRGISSSIEFIELRYVGSNWQAFNLQRVSNANSNLDSSRYWLCSIHIRLLLFGVRLHTSSPSRWYDFAAVPGRILVG